MLRLLTAVWLACTVTCLMCGPAIAQAPKAKPKPKTGAAGKDASKRPAPPKPPTPTPFDEDTPSAPPRVDPYLHVGVDASLTKQVVAKLRSDTVKALAAGKYEGDQEESLQRYYRKWVLPSWTQEANYHMLTKMRTDLRTTELRQGKPGQPHTDALDILLRGLKRITAENFHPVVRYNAMLAIGELNEEEPVGVSGLPTPLAEALPVLVDALSDDKQIDAVKVAALVGLTRHALRGIADQQIVTQKLTPALLKLAAEKAPPASRSADGHDWMRCRAMDLLGLLRSVGNNNVVATTFSTILADKKDSPESKDKEMLVRSAAARGLGSLNYANVSGLNVVSLAESLTGLALDVCGRETAPRASGEEPTLVRRRLRAQLHAVAQGFNGVDEQYKGIRGLAQDTPNKDYVEKLYAAVQELVASFDKKDPREPREDISDPDLMKAIGQGTTAMRNLIEQHANGGVAKADDGAKPGPDKPAGTEAAPKPPAATTAKPGPSAPEF